MTGLQSSGAARRPARIPNEQELPPLLERTPLALIDESITFLRTQPATLLGVAFAILLPLRLIVILLPGSGLRDARPDQLLDILASSVTSGGGFAAAVGTQIADSLAVFVVGAIYGKLLASWYDDEAPLASDLLVWSIRRSPVLAVLWIVAHVVQVALGVFSVGIGALIFGVLFMVSAPVLGAERTGIRGSLSRSLSLTSHRFFPCLIVFLLVAGIGQTIRFVLRTLPTLLGVTVIPIPAWIISGVFDLLATTVTVAFTAASALVLYLDLRVRREGIDLEVAMGRAFPERGTNFG